jgi:hypothetical protein
MKRLARRLAVGIAVIGGMAAIASRTGLVATDVGVLFGALGAVAACVILVLKDMNAVAPQSPTSRFDAVAARRRQPAPVGPVRLRALERDIALALPDARRCHTIVRPLLRDMAAEVLDNALAIDLGTDPSAAREILGPQVWELIGPDRPAPASGLRDPAPQIELITAAVDRLEEL